MRPDLFDEYARSLPSGDTRGMSSAAGVATNGRKACNESFGAIQMSPTTVLFKRNADQP